MTKKFILTLFMFGVLLGSGAVVAKQTLFIQSAKAALLAQPQFSAKKLAVLHKGAEVDALQTTANWTQVSHNGKTGWIANMLLNSQAPLPRTQLRQPEAEKPQHKARKRASIQATAAATRGLKDQFRQRSMEPQDTDYDALSQMEHQHPEEQDVDEFHKALSH